MERAYTATQGQYLAFIYYYTKLHGVPPAEADMQRYFKVSPRPSTTWSSPWRSGSLSHGHQARVGRFNFC